MKQANETDLGPLTWVKGEIDAALQRSATALAEARRAEDPAARVQFAQTHLHQVRGALSIISLDGLTQFADAAEVLLGLMSRGELPIDVNSLSLASRAVASIGNYLEEIAHGAPDQPLRLAPLYEEIALARGLPLPCAGDLFHPDLSRRPPRRDTTSHASESAASQAAEYQTRLRLTRPLFERGLLEWLRGNADKGAQAMRDAIAEVEALQATPAQRSLWWASLAFFDGLIEHSLPIDSSVKRLCTQIDAQFRRLLAGSPSSSDRLLREILYRVALLPARTAQQQAVRECWQLDALLPPPDTPISDIPLGPLLQELQQALIGVREQWDDFSGGTAIALTRFDERLSTLVLPTRTLGRPATARLVGGLLTLVQWLRRDPLQHSDALALEVATALLLLEADFGQRVSDTALAQQMDQRLKRIQALVHGEALGTDTSIADSGGARASQEREALTQLCSEMRVSLAQVEQTLDDYFRNQAKHEPLTQLHRPLQQIVGALSVLGETGALELVRDAGMRIASLVNAPADADGAAFEALAHPLSALGFYLEALPHGAVELDDFLHPERRRERDSRTAEHMASTLAAAQIARPRAATTIDSPLTAEASTSVPAAHTTAAGSLDLSTLELPDLELPDLEPLKAPSAESAPREMLAKASPLATNQEERVQLEVLAPDTSAPNRAPSMSASSLPVSDAEVDAELLGIFIEEANEVLASIREALEGARNATQHVEQLTIIRRGFHTLKGSGRMVGLAALGEAAWGLEQTLNSWLQLDWPVTPAVLHLINAGQHLFSIWVEALQSGSNAIPDPSALLAEAERLRSGETAIDESAMTTALETQSAVAPTQSEAAAAESETAPGEVQYPPLGPETASIEPKASPTESELKPASVTSPREIDTWLNFPRLDLGKHEEVSTLLDEKETGAAASGAAIPDFLIETKTIDFDIVPDLDFGLDLDLDFDLDVTADGELTVDLDAELEVEQGAPITDGEPEADEPLPETSDVPAAETAPGPPAVAVAEPHSAASAPLDASLRIGDAELSPALFALFQAEALQHVSTLAREMDRLAQHPDAVPTELALRAAHTLGGIAGTARLIPPHELARALEQAIERLRDQGRAPSTDELTVLGESVHTLQAMLTEISAQTLPDRAQAQVAALDHCGYARSMTQKSLDEASAASSAPLTRSVTSPIIVATAAELVAPPQDELDSQLLPIFLEEAGELFATLHATLRAWRVAPEASQHPVTIARLLHSLKGSARMAGAMTLGSHLHQLESRLEDGLAGKLDTVALIDDLAFGLDVSEQMIDQIAGLPPHALDPLSDTETNLPPPVGAPSAPAPLRAATTTIGPEVGGGGEAEPISAATLRVRAEQVDQFVNQAGEIGVSRIRTEGELRTLRRSLLDLTENVIRLRKQLREVEIQAEVQMQSRIAQAESHHGEFDPLEMDRYTRLQELTRMMAESVNDVTTVQQTLLHNLDGADLALNGQARTTRELQQGLMRVRMLPFDSLADRLYRVVRQSAKEIGKRATLDLRGGRIEIDRSVLEQMAAPLEHLLRNAVAHGIESPAERSAANKPESGQLVLSVTQEGNEIAIDLSDDGRGLDFERIAERARANGLLTADEHPDDKRLTNLIFLSGFSTATQLSAVSGRGVGMDVVKAQTAAVGGRIDVSSRAGQGTSFRIYLPLTLAVTQALLVKAGGRSWAIPSNMVAQAMELKPDALRRVQAEHGIDWQGEHYAYRYLPRLLGDRELQPIEQRYNWLLLLRVGAQTLALHVDGLRGNQEIVVKKAGPQLTRIIGMAGATVLPDGEVALILNPVALASRSLSSGIDADETGARIEAPAVVVKPPTIMVVDDSLTVRRITGRLLEREGYRVITAKDGVDALEQLIDAEPDVILSDIEMPRMDGFDLVRNIRADARLRAVPVIMITSRLADKHRRYAEEVGANHYLGKPYQEEELLALLSSYTRKAIA